MKKRWQKFEDQVREIATLIYGRPCQPKQIAGCDIDGFIELDEGQVVLFEITVNHTLRKVREDTTKLIQVRAALFSQGKFALCRIITDGVPTESMCQGGRSNNVDVWSFNELAAQFIEYENYRSARSDYPFGSSIDPQTGEIDRIKYVPVLYEDRNLKKSYSTKDIGEMIASGRQIVLLGEYGTGKSRCCSEVFEYIAKEWGITFLFPFAINLRECWGLEDAIELLRRHVRNLGLGRMEGSAVRAFNRRNLLFILDGFDEVGTQSWSIDDARLRQLRAKALVAIKDAITNSGNGTLITGREHYFSSQNEMFAALGLDPTRTLVLHVKEEFSLDEMLDYFRAANISVELPDWLPRRPLICQTISQLTDDDLEGMLGRGSEANFFNYFIRVVAKRDSRINASFDEETIHRVFLELAALTRVKSGDVGPINQRELQDAFEAVVGRIPVEDAAVMLLRLPSLGRVSPESSDRQFIDKYILDGLRAQHVVALANGDEESRSKVSKQTWSNPLENLGQQVLGMEIAKRFGAFESIAQKSAKEANSTLAADIVASSMRTVKDADFKSIIIKSSAISELDFSKNKATNVCISGSIIGEIILPANAPNNVVLKQNVVAKVSGASSADGLSEWVRDNEFESFDSVRTVRRIRDAGLSPPEEILVAIVKKTFFQPGAGRKEEALLRGFAAGSYNKIAPKVLRLLVAEGILRTFKGEDGLVYAPDRSHAGRMKKMMDQLRVSDDPLWGKVLDL